jgi:hypothetical protein
VDTRIAPGETKGIDPPEAKDDYKPEEVLQESQLYSWQRWVLNKIKKIPDRRTIYWLYDEEGHTGKSVFCQWLFMKGLGEFLEYARASDLKNHVSKIVAKKRHPRAFLIDLPRTRPADISGSEMYSAMESIKNGLVFNSKYETSVANFRRPHVFVFANHAPKREAMSQDRWRVIDIRHKWKSDFPIGFKPVDHVESDHSDQEDDVAGLKPFKVDEPMEVCEKNESSDKMKK